MYSGQLIRFKEERRKHDSLKSVRMTAVDNFQGEENNIVLLSLVRSNKDGKIGFLSTENRVCVALSRAKHGLYIIGNMDCLTVKPNCIWNKIKNSLESQNSFGAELSLKCQVHGTITNVSSGKDFLNVAEGGCNLPCKRLMSCGHECKMLCHVTDIEHLKTSCYEKCERDICLKEKHPCPLKCYKKCQPCAVPMRHTLGCGHDITLPCAKDPSEANCLENVETKLDLCDHIVMKPCCIKVEDFNCTEKCEDRLPCGHSCIKKCHKKNDPEHLEYICFKTCGRKNFKCSQSHKCEKRCYEDCLECPILITKTLSCGHTSKVLCSLDISEYSCKKKCKKTLPCGHQCNKECYKECGSCSIMVTKTIPDCGHTVRSTCSSEVSRNMCKAQCNRKLKCGHTCRGLCKVDCSQYKCNELVNYQSFLACGHQGIIPCHKRLEDLDPTDDDIMKFCQNKCTFKLPCEDLCSGTCGECMQGRLHKFCAASCGNILICGHSCKVPCRNDCPPCKEKCTYRCVHSKCTKLCGEPCSRCKERCQWKCIHHSCKKLCYEICDRPPCNEPCIKFLICGHPCVGLCGEKCPPLCRICNSEELTEIIFGTEDKEDARFIYLPDCKHTIEASALDRWIENFEEQENGAIRPLTCPRCKTQIQKTLRYSNYVKRIYCDVQRVKKKIFGESMLINKLAKENADGLEELKQILPPEKSNNEYYKIILDKLIKAEKERTIQGKLITTGNKRNLKRKVIGEGELKLNKFIIEFLKRLISSIKDVDPNCPNSNTYFQKFGKKIFSRFNLLLYHLSIRNLKLSQQEQNQFKVELDRFKFIVTAHMKLRSSLTCNFNKMQHIFIQLSNDCFSVKEFTKLEEKKNGEKLNELLASLKQVKVTPEEFKMVHEAMKSSFHSIAKVGHWMKCSNGHIYCITECGGAMQRSNCPECKEVIGGGNHTLVNTSTVATEVDGALYGAFSNRANLNNYHF